MTAIYHSRERANEAVDKIKIYARPQRLMILSCLLDRERTVAEINDATGVGQPALSQQLAELRRAELVETRRVAKQVYYRLANNDVSVCVRSIEAIFARDGDVVKALSGVVAEQPKPAQKARGGVGAAAFAKVI